MEKGKKGDFGIIVNFEVPRQLFSLAWNPKTGNITISTGEENEEGTRRDWNEIAGWDEATADFDGDCDPEILAEGVIEKLHDRGLDDVTNHFQEAGNKLAEEISLYLQEKYAGEQ